MKLKSYEQPNVEIEYFYKDVILSSIRSSLQDEWDDYENAEELY